jgi:tetratricopeptide (TPR) repeat protein
LNVSIYTSIINNPDTINDIQRISLERIVIDFPYFQSARALHLKGLYNQNSFKYNSSLKVTATHTTDRSVLFDFITSDKFTAIDRNVYNKKIEELNNITVKETEFIEVENEKKLEPKENTLEESILTTIKSADTEIKSDPIIEEIEIESNTNQEFVPVETPEIEINEKLELGKPLSFTTNEVHSFNEWLQLSKMKPIERDEKNNEFNTTSEDDSEKQKKNTLIDRFIETNPKIPQVKHDSPLPSVFFEPSNADNSSLMTETLARVYLEQKKYQKAIQAYQILILKYPEKSSFFADRILDIKNLQQNNN